MRRGWLGRRIGKEAYMADATARKAAIKKASQQVRAGGVFSRASATSKVAARSTATASSQKRR
jgi:hypothetical protein